MNDLFTALTTAVESQSTTTKDELHDNLKTLGNFERVAEESKQVVQQLLVDEFDDPTNMT